MIYGVAANNLWIIILVEAMVCITSLLVALADLRSPLSLVLMVPTAICLVDFIILDQVVGVALRKLVRR
jgi:hypothetical protein